MPRILTLGLVVLLLVGSIILMPLYPATAQVTPRNYGELRVVNALVGLGEVDIYLDGAPIALATGSLAAEVNIQTSIISSTQPIPVITQTRAATPYLVVPEGRHILAAYLPGADPVNSVPIADTLLTTVPNSSQTAVLYQKLYAEPPNADSGQPGYIPPVVQSGAIMVIDDDRSPIQLGQTRLTALHLAVTTEQRISITYPSRASLLHQVEKESPYGTIDINAGTYRLNVVDADSPDLATLSNINGYYFNANTLYTLIVVPDVRPVVAPGGGIIVGQSSQRLQVFAVSSPVEEPPGGMRIRLLHAAYNTQVVDVYIDEHLVAQQMFYGRYTEYLGIPNFSHTIALRSTGTSATSQPLAQATITVNPDALDQRDWTLLLLNAGAETEAALALPLTTDETVTSTRLSTVLNTPGGSMLMTLLPDNTSEVLGDFARIRVVNAADGAPPLRVITQDYPLRPAPPGTIPSPTPTLRPNDPIPEPPILVDTVIFAAEAGERTIPDGRYQQMEFYPAASSNPFVTLTDVPLLKGFVYTFVVVGSPTGNPQIQVLRFQDYGRGVTPTGLYVGIINNANTVIRQTPAVNGARVDALPGGTQVRVLGRNEVGDWLRIEFPNTRPNRFEYLQGWVQARPQVINVTRLSAPVDVLNIPIFPE